MIQIKMMHQDVKNKSVGKAITLTLMIEDATLTLKDANIIKVRQSVNNAQILTYFMIENAYQLLTSA